MGRRDQRELAPAFRCVRWGRPLQAYSADSDLKKKLSELQWNAPDFWIAYECEISPITCELSVLRGGATKIRFETLYGIPCEVLVRRDDHVIKWSCGDTYSHDFTLNDAWERISSRLRVGEIEYIDDLYSLVGTLGAYDRNAVRRAPG